MKISIKYHPNYPLPEPIPTIFIDNDPILGTSTYGKKDLIIEWIDDLGYDGENIWKEFQQNSC